MRPEMAERAAIWSQHEHARRVLRHVLATCGEVGIRALPVKGVLTAHLLYSDPSERRIQDIDLRVTPRDFARLERLASSGNGVGFRILHASRACRNLVFDVEGMMVEFEAHIGPRGLCRLPIESVLGRAQVHEAPFGFPHLQAELHDHALLLVINAYKDKVLEAPPWAIRDLELIGARPDFEPRRLAKLATESGVAALTWIVADWLAGMRDQPAWAAVREHLDTAPRRTYRRLVRRALGVDPVRSCRSGVAESEAPRSGVPEGEPPRSGVADGEPPSHHSAPHPFLAKPLPRLALRVLVRAAADAWTGQLAAVGMTLAGSLEQVGRQRKRLKSHAT